MTAVIVRALAFDVFGTVVDWRSTVVDELTAFGERRSVAADWVGLADAWRHSYHDGIAAMNRGEIERTDVDTLHRRALDLLLAEHAVEGVSEEEADELSRVWHRLRPWPDTVAGLVRLKSKYTIATLSNGNVELLEQMASAAGLPWDRVLSAYAAERYKPDRATYLMAAEALSLAPEQVMMVAAHVRDLRGAAAAGLRTAYVPRPDEWGPASVGVEPAEEFDVSATDFVALADALGA